MTDRGEDFRQAGRLEELPVGVGRLRRVDGVPVLLCRTGEGAVFAIEDLCPHLRLSMDGGKVRRDTILCPRHGARFDLRTGQSVNGVTSGQVRVFATRVVDDEVLVDISSTGRVWPVARLS